MSSSSSSSSSKSNQALMESKFTMVFQIICHIHGLINIIMASEPLDMVGSDLERQAFIDFKAAIVYMKEGSPNMLPAMDTFIKTLSTLLNKSYNDILGFDIVVAWDKTIQVMTVVMPPFHDIFLGHIPQVNDMPQGWLYVIPHYVQALFYDKFKSLDDVLRSCLEQARSDYETDAECNENMSNAIIIQRSPEILAISCESALLPDSLRRQSVSHNSTIPSSIEFPMAMDLSVYQMSSNDMEDDEEDVSLSQRHYDLVAVISLDTATFTKYSSHLRLSQDSGYSLGNYGDVWTKGFDTKETVTTNQAVYGSYFNSGSSSSVPRFLLYVKRGLTDLLTRLQPFVSKAGQCRAMGDMTYALATTIENYKEARRYYEEAIGYDKSYEDMLKDTLQSLDKIDSIQHSRGLEEQGDISLVNHRLKESCEFYHQASSTLANLNIHASTSNHSQGNVSSAIVPSSSSAANAHSSSSLVGLTSLAGLTASYDDRLKEKLSLVKQMQSLEIVVHFVEKAEEALRDCKYSNAKDHYNKAIKLNPNQIFNDHFTVISSYVDKTMQTLVAIQKIDDAHIAMKEGKYRLANQLFSEAIVLVPDKASGLQNILDGFTPLIQCEDALIQQRAGLQAFEEKNYSTAVNLLTEAINLLPLERATDLAIFYSDRAMIWQELHEYEKSLDDCSQAMALKSDYALAHFRKGTALFSLGKYTDAISAYDKAEGFDPSLSSQVKTKLRQVNTAKEVAQRKEREAERARAKEEERRLIELAKKERAEKALQEQAEKTERQRMKEEDKLSKQLREESTAKSDADATASSSSKEIERQRQKEAEKLRQREERAKEKERQRIEKERERDRLRQEKEAASIRQQQEKQAQLELKLRQDQEALIAQQKEQARILEQQRLERERKEEERRQKLLAKEKADKEAQAARDAKAKLLEQQRDDALKLQKEQERIKKEKEVEIIRKKQQDEEERKMNAIKATEKKRMEDEAATRQAGEAALQVANNILGNDGDSDTYDMASSASKLGSYAPYDFHDMFRSSSYNGLDYNDISSSMTRGSVMGYDNNPSLSNLGYSSYLPEVQRAVTADSYLYSNNNLSFMNFAAGSHTSLGSIVNSPERKPNSPTSKMDLNMMHNLSSDSMIDPMNESKSSGQTAFYPEYSFPAPSLLSSNNLGLHSTSDPSFPQVMSELNASAPQFHSASMDKRLENNYMLSGSIMSPLERSASYPQPQDGMSSVFNLPGDFSHLLTRNIYNVEHLEDPTYRGAFGSSNKAQGYTDNNAPNMNDFISVFARKSSPGPISVQPNALSSSTSAISDSFALDSSFTFLNEPDTNGFPNNNSSSSRQSNLHSTKFSPTIMTDSFHVISRDSREKLTLSKISDSRFPVVLSLQTLNIHLYGFGNPSLPEKGPSVPAFAYYALNIPSEIYYHFTPMKINDLNRSGCKVWIENILPQNDETTWAYLVFRYGDNIQENEKMMAALQLATELILSMSGIGSATKTSIIGNASLPSNTATAPTTSSNVLLNTSTKTVPPSLDSEKEFPPLGSTTTSTISKNSLPSFASSIPPSNMSDDKMSLHGKINSTSTSASWQMPSASNVGAIGVGIANMGQAPSNTSTFMAGPGQYPQPGNHMHGVEYPMASWSPLVSDILYPNDVRFSTPETQNLFQPNMSTNITNNAGKK